MNSFYDSLMGYVFAAVVAGVVAFLAAGFVTMVTTSSWRLLSWLIFGVVFVACFSRFVWLDRQYAQEYASEYSEEREG